MAVARREGRVLLTRDSGLIERRRAAPGPPVHPERRLAVPGPPGSGRFRSLGRGPAAYALPRLQVALKPLSRERARNLVAPYVLENGGGFAVCPGCGRVFWRGTHYGRMEKKIEKILERRGRSITG